MMSDLVLFLTALSLGFLGSGHCFLMCGAIAGTLGCAQKNEGRLNHLLFVYYHVGRIFSYTVLGSVFGFFSYQLQLHVHFVQLVLPVLSGFLLIAMGLYIADWWRGLTALERFGYQLWRRLQPLSSRLLPVQSFRQAFGFGLLWGYIPCGLVYSALSWSVLCEHWYQSALIMFGFGMGTMPALYLTGVSAQKFQVFMGASLVRAIAGVLLIGFGVWLMLGLGGGHAHHH